MYFVGVLIFALVLSIILTYSMVKQQKQRHLPAERLGNGNMYLDSDSFDLTRKSDKFVRSHTSRTRINPSGPSSSFNNAAGGLLTSVIRSGMSDNHSHKNRR